VVQCRDIIGARLLDTQIANTAVVTENGLSSHKWGFAVPAGGLNAVVTHILNTTWAWAYGTSFPEPLVTPTPHATLVLGEFWQDRLANLGEALRVQVLKAGYDIRGRWEPPGYGQDTFLLTLYPPARLGPVSPVFFFHYPKDAPPGSGQLYYHRITKLSQPLANVRNVWEGTPFDPANPAVRIPQVVSDPASIARYGTVGYRFAYIAEDRASGIDTPGKMAVMIQGALADHKESHAGVSVQTPYCWMVEPGDFIYLGADPARSDIIGPLSVTGATHEFDQGDAWSTFEAGPTGAVAAALREVEKTLVPSRRVYIATAASQGPGREGDIWVVVPSPLTVPTS
jgi:hypothetical protein